MGIKEFFGIVVKKIWVVILVSVVSVSISGFVSYNFLQPVYVSRCTLFVMNRNLTSQSSALAYSDIMIGGQLVKDYSELIRSRAVTSEVIKELKINNLSPEGLASKISVNSKNETRIIEISVQDSDPQRSKELTDEVATVFVHKVKEIMNAENVSIIDTAQVPFAPIKPNPEVNMLVAFLGAVLFSLGLIFLSNHLDERIKTSEDIKKQFDLPVMGMIPDFNIK